jgi:hypothetical protein
MRGRQCRGADRSGALRRHFRQPAVSQRRPAGNVEAVGVFSGSGASASRNIYVTFTRLLCPSIDASGAVPGFR